MARRLALILGALVLLVLLLAGGAVAWLVWHPETIKGPLERRLSTALGAPVQIEGPLELDLGLAPVVELNNVSVAAPDWAISPTLATVRRLRVGLDLGAWLGRRGLVVTELLLDAPRLSLERDAEGRTSWPAAESEPTDGPAVLPEIHALTIHDGHVDYRDAVTGVSLQTAAHTTAPADAASVGFGSLSLEGGGEVRGERVSLSLEVGSPLLLARAGTPFPLHGQLTAGDSRLQLQGEVRDPLALDGLAVSLDLASDDPEPLLALLGQPGAAGLPELTAKARLTGEGSVFALDDLAVAWGRSRVDGRLRYDETAERPRLDGELHAPVLDMLALQPLLERERPDAGPADFGPLLTHDGHLSLTAAEIRLPAVTVHDIAAELRLDAGRLTVDPLRAGLPEGQVAGRLASGPLDETFTAEVALRAEGVDLAPFASAESGLGGVLDGELTGTLRGVTGHEILARSGLRLRGQGQLRLPQLGEQLHAVAFEATLEPGRDRPLRVVAESRLGETPLRMEMGGGSLELLVEGKGDYPVVLNVTGGPVRGEAEGTIGWPLAANGLDLAVTAGVSDFDLAALAGPEGAIGGVLTGELSGRLQGADPVAALTQSELRVDGQVQDLRLPRLAEPLSRVTLEGTLAPARERPLNLVADSSTRDKPLHLEAQLGDPRILAGAEADYPLTLAATFGDTKASADGTIAWPLKRGGLDLALTLEGPDPAEFLALLQLPEIKLPPYRVAGQVRREGTTWRFGGLAGRVGDSDLGGDLELRLDGPRPVVSGSLASKQLDLNDLGGLIGAEPGTGPGETASPEQKADAQAAMADQEVLPDQPMDPARWQRVDIDLELAATNVTAGRIPFDAFEMGVALEEGRLRVEPLTFRLGDGRITGSIGVDARQAPAAAQLELDMEALPVGRLLSRLDIDVARFGTLSGRARGDVGLGGRGFSVKQVASNADGEITLVMTGGAINRQLVSMIGLDLLDLFGGLFGTTPEEVELRCTLVDLAVRDGVVSTRSLVIDTPLADLAGEGRLDLGSERVELELLARPKQAPLPSGHTGIRITGTLAEPRISYDAATLLARGAFAATFGVLLSPFTALAATIAGAGGEGPGGCRDLIASGQVPQDAVEGNRNRDGGETGTRAR